MLPERSLQPLLAPRSVAVIGASDDASKVGGRVLSYLLSGRYRGRVFAVNPKQPRVQDHPAFASIDRIDEPIDTAIIALPPPACVDAFAQCAAVGVKTAIVLTSGFREAGAEGAARQKALVDIVRESPIRLLGPNCLGVVNERAGYAGTFATMWKEPWPQPGSVAIVTQSGATASYFYVMLRERGVGISAWIATGNEADVDVAECVRHVAGDESTRVVIAAMEGVGNGPALLDAIAAARAAGKPVLIMKVGKSAVAVDAVRSHTGALAGDDRVFDAAIRQAGAIRCASFEDAADLACACAIGAYPRGPRVGFISASGGAGILMTDVAEDKGLSVPELSAPLRGDLDAMLPGGNSRNPVDVTAMVLNDLGLMVKPIELLRQSGEVDAVVAFLTSAFRSDQSVSNVIEALQRQAPSDVPLILSAFTSTENLKRLQQAGYATFVDPARAVNTVDALRRIASWERRTFANQDRVRSLMPPVSLSEASLLEFFALQGIPCSPTREVSSRREAILVAVGFGFPVAMKVSLSGLAHKSETGGVRIGITDSTQAEEAYESLASIGRRLAPNAPARVTVQKMIAGRCEMMMGFRNDDVFGPVVVLGFGGKWVEIIDDVVLRIAPFDREEALAMIDELRGRKLLDAVRGEPAADVGALADALTAFSKLVGRLDRVESAEINPFIVGPAGAGGFAVDAKLVVAA